MMLTVKEAAKIGVNACIDKIGRDFVLANRNYGTSAYGERDGGVFCFVGVDDRPYVPDRSGMLVLDSMSKFPYRASCNVGLDDGKLEFIECVAPA